MSYYFPHILVEYNTRIDNLHIFILRFVPKKTRSTGVSSTNLFFSGLADGLQGANLPMYDDAIVLGTDLQQLHWQTSMKFLS